MKPENTHFKRKLLKILIVIICIFVIAICVGFIIDNREPQIVSQPDDGTLHQAMVYYNNQMFFHRGHYAEELPTDAKLLGQTNFISDIFSLKNDLDSNEHGFLYMDPNDEGTLYIEHTPWDEEVDGPKKYIILKRDSAE